ncbi:drug/metabolite transporter (DMT) superfamily permease [Pseudomonas sp. BAY1663]|jgi:hypothetical protein|uniref:hypothetical protein n=1 Tax=Pseudomonas sp. BAY1663 TaxID=1439940 RepID=UPI00042DE30A|nr:hypothetical protein [Pseudomonas sp. BAY1663]EXF44813.1 drug/metabolite transporter (DMT) superfamily permease [Pseudomonas sp. BAY1663]
MLIGALLVLTWLILLIRYPLRAVPVSLGAALGLVLIAGWVLWQEHREEQLLAQLELRLVYAPERCPGAQPLYTSLHNHSDKPLQELRWEVAAYAPGSRTNLARATFEAPTYQGPGDLQSGAHWESCLPLPPLRSGYRAATLEFRAERLQGRFAN